MTQFQQIVKYLAIGLAVFLAVSIVMGGISILAAIFGLGQYKVLDDFYDVELSQNIEALDIDLSAASLKIIVGERFSLSTNIENLTVNSDDSRLYIKQEQKTISIHSTKIGEIILTIPANVKFQYFKLDAGAGEVDIELLNTQNAEIEMGAGALTVNGGEIGGLDLDLGVGETNLTATLNGNTTINCGVGETNIILVGQKSDYTLDIDTGIGEITLDKMRIKNDTVIGNGKNELEIDGGVGSINIEFVTEQ